MNRQDDTGNPASINIMQHRLRIVPRLRYTRFYVFRRILLILLMKYDTGSQRLFND